MKPTEILNLQPFRMKTWSREKIDEVAIELGDDEATNGKTRADVYEAFLGEPVAILDGDEYGEWLVCELHIEVLEKEFPTLDVRETMRAYAAESKAERHVFNIGNGVGCIRNYCRERRVVIQQQEAIRQRDRRRLRAIEALRTASDLATLGPDEKEAIEHAIAELSGATLVELLGGSITEVTRGGVEISVDGISRELHVALPQHRVRQWGALIGAPVRIRIEPEPDPISLVVSNEEFDTEQEVG